MDTLEPSQGFHSLGLIACVTYLTATSETSFVLEHPTSAWVIILSVCSCIILLSDRIQLLFSRPDRRGQQYSAVPLEDIYRDAHALSPPATGGLSPASLPSKSRIWLHRGLISLILIIRVRILQSVGAKTSTARLETIVPIFAALAECWQIFHQNRPSSRGNERNGKLQTIAIKSLFKHTYSSVIYTAIFCWFAALAIAHSPSSLRTSYLSFGHRLDSFTATTPLQLVGIALDGALVIYLTITIHQAAAHPLQGKNEAMFSLGVSGLIAGAACLVLGLSSHIFKSFNSTEHGFDGSNNYVSRTIKLAFAVGLLTFFALHTLSRCGVLDTSLLTICTVATVSLFYKIWNQPTPFLDAHELKSFIPLGLLVGVILRALANLAREWFANAQPRPDSPKRRWSLFYVFGVLFTLQALLAYWGHFELRDHQVDSLIHGAKRRHDSWLKAASSSNSLAEATRNYIARYNQTPPPHFDQWYEFATNRSSLVIDDFDPIYEDLAPFWSFSPAEIRHRTKETLLAPTGGIGGITIRDGIASISGNTPGTHIWMLNGIIDMIDKFGRFLPDMDLAFNLNDECRVSVPYDELQKTRKVFQRGAVGQAIGHKPLNDFSASRADGWTVQPDEHLDNNRFIILSFQNTFDFSSAHCPPDSPARSERYLDPATFCASCAAPHSLDLFLSNWTLAADVCHQPDLAHLHGFYISPAAFDATSHLIPIFSQSKAGGFNDIRYPSPWNYLDKAKYDPSEEFPDPNFDVKKKALFWRGATTEAFAKTGSGAWKGMSRERFVNLASNDAPQQALLLPDPKKHDAKGLHLRYAFIDSFSLREGINTDVQFTEINRCDGPECDEEAKHFTLGQRKDFQEHWSYKYLLDLDGAGFSGRFLPFLFSKSLPFKTTLFREWWENRLTPWVHFVPLDLRGHGLWATLAYFAGFEGTVGEGNVRWPPRDLQAKAIAEDGASWARKVLRKEDMEIYMFRLLLEWGRLTDDRRSEIGFTVNP